MATVEGNDDKEMGLGLRRDLGSCKGTVVHRNAAQALTPKATMVPEEKEGLWEEQTGTLNQSSLHHAVGEALVKGCMDDDLFLERGLKVNFQQKR